MRIAPEIKSALADGRPVVALESTIISHGMPYPRNAQTALEVEDDIRSEGAIPATIGIIKGEIVVGMTPAEIDDFGRKEGIAKVSKRDLPIVVAKKQYGATTVSATMLIAKMAGIPIFVTGGIGGVHRHAEETFDISRDLRELGEVDVCVVCSGAKAILDIPKTLEYLETEGVSVLSHKAKTFANFYSLSSDGPVDCVFDSPKEAAEILLAKKDLNLKGGVLISNPVPEEMALPHEYIDSIVDQAVRESEELGIKGKDSTPFLLKRIVELSGGKSLDTNVALIRHNAHLGARIAVELSKLERGRG